jgi:putative hydrolase of the HAD superfamily
LIKAIIFDWFNTLACYEPPREEIHSRILKEFGIVIEPVKLISPLLEADRYFFGESAILPIRKRSVEEIDSLYTKYEEILMTEAGIKFEKGLPAKVYHKGKDRFGDNLKFVLFEDVLPTMGQLQKRKLIIGLLTNLAKDMAPLVRQLGLKSYLNFVTTPHDAGADKPDPKIFLVALDKAGINADEAIYVGDQYKVDILGARNAGIKAIMIDRYNLFTGSPDFPRITSLSELENYIN